jgi:hypothetical protein
MSGDSKKEIDAPSKLFPTDKKVVVTSGEASLQLQNSGWKIILDERAELQYVWLVNNKNIFDITTSKAWMTGGKQAILRLKFLQASPVHEETILFAFQNAVASTFVVLKGSAVIESRKTNDQITLGIGQKITVTTADDIQGKYLLQDKVSPIDADMQSENLFIRYGQGLLIWSTPSVTGTGSTGSGTMTSNTKKNIRFTSPEDESTAPTGAVDIAWNYGNDTVTKITVNEVMIPLKKEDKTFEVKNFQLKKWTNNLVYKAYDSEGILLEKWIITVYAQNGWQNQGEEGDPKIPSVKTYPITSKDFPLLSPTNNPYQTQKDVIKIEGRAPKQLVKYITINGYRLTKFIPYSSYWYYFANKDQGTLNDGINTYEIFYYGSNDEKIAENFLSIVRAPADIESTTASGSEITQ